MKRKAIFIAVMVMLVAYSAVIVTRTAYLLTFPQDTHRLNVHPMEMITKEARKGETVQYIADICKLADKPVLVERFIQTPTKEQWKWSEQISHLKKGCVKATVTTLPLPDWITPGEHKIVLRATTYIEQGKESVEWYETTPFQVIE